MQQIKYAQSMLVLTILCAVLGTVVTITQMVLLSRIVSQVFLSHQGLEQVGMLLLFLLGMIVVRAAFVWGREVSAQQSAVRVKAELRARLFTHLLQLGPTFCKGERTGELVTVASEGIERLDGYVSRYLPQVVLSVLIPLLIVLTIFPLDWSSALLLLITGPIIPLLMILVGSYAEKHIQHQWVALSRMGAYFLDVIQGLTTLKLFGRSQTEQERIAHVSENFRDKTLKVLRVAFLSGGILEFMTAIAIGL
ncbi:MAG TPA: ABC transporter transmembrane domain-containing protein, partial [Ktedonobacteraceae bacterium]|nr:ABC transporter transmembrane domain-containing protein [Ktedonobacteraceae bacterium]